MNDIEYCNKLIEIMISRTKNLELKSKLMYSYLEMRRHGMNGDLCECSMTLYFNNDEDYFYVKENSLKNEIEKLLNDCITETDGLYVIEFKIGIADDGIELQDNESVLLTDIYRLERLINHNRSSEMVSFFDNLSIKYSSLVNGWIDITSKELMKNDVALDRDKVKSHALKILKILKDHYKIVKNNELVKNNSSIVQLYKQDNRYDVFISHANADKLDYVDELKTEIERLGVEVFYDSEEIKWGDDWKQKIFNGIENSRFAIIVISKNFVNREWTEKELNEFFKKQNQNKQKTILPILYGIDETEVFKYYPNLKNIQFIKASKFSVETIAITFLKELLKDLKRRN